MSKSFNLITGISNKDINFVQLSSKVNLEALKGDDKEPLEIIVEVPVGKSKRGWNYTDKAIKDIVDTVNSETLNGFLGHQKAENVDNEFPDIQTHWLGAKFDDTTKIGYFRGLIDKEALKLKRWIKSGRIKQVSIFGQPQIEKDKAGNTNVVGYKPLSIDWTPLNRAGMPTRIIATSGEMFDYFGESDTSTVEDRLKAKYGNDVVILTKDNNKIQIAVKQSSGKFETKEINCDTMDSDNTNNEEVEEVEKGDILKNLRVQYLEGKINDAEITEVLKLTKKTIISDDIAAEVGEMTASQIKEAKDAKEELVTAKATAVKTQVLDKVIKAKVSGEQAITFVKETFQTAEIDEEKITGELEEFLKKPVIAQTINGLLKVTKPNTSSTNLGGYNSGDSGTNGGGYLEDNAFLLPKI